VDFCFTGDPFSVEKLTPAQLAKTILKRLGQKISLPLSLLTYFFEYLDFFIFFVIAPKVGITNKDNSMRATIITVIILPTNLTVSFPIRSTSAQTIPMYIIALDTFINSDMYGSKDNTM